MKKIIAGMFYRLIKGFELWALLILMTISSIYFYYVFVGTEDFNSLLRNNEVCYERYRGTDYAISASNVKQYRFESLGISASDVYKENVEPISDASFKILLGKYNYAYEEVSALINSLGNLHFIPSILMMIFIPVFFGRMFSDGTMKNIISCGHSKGKIYISSLFVTIVLDLVLFMINFAGFLFWCLVYEWKPPIYLPVLLPYMTVIFLLMLVLSSVNLAVLFASQKKTAAFVAGLLLLVSLRASLSTLAYSFMGVSYHTDPNKADYIRMEEIIETQGRNAIEHRLELSDLSIKPYYEGEELDVYTDVKWDPGAKVLLLGMFYSDPGLTAHLGNYIPLYLMVRDGLVTANMICSVSWLVISSAVGYAVFSKREIHC